MRARAAYCLASKQIIAGHVAIKLVLAMITHRLMIDSMQHLRIKLQTAIASLQ